MDDLLKAFQMFQGSVQQAAVSNAVEGASQHMNQINAQISDEAQKRQALQNLGNNLALRLTGVGANAAQVEQAFRAVSPQNFGSAEQLQLEGQLSGNKQYQQVAGDIMKQREEKQQKLMWTQHAQELEKLKKANEYELMREMVKNGSKVKDVKSEDIAFDVNIDVANNMINQLEETIKDQGTYANQFTQPEAAATFESIPYKLAITYAKIVDPNSVARESEVDAAKKYLIPLGLMTTDAKALAALKQMRETIADYAKARTRVSGRPMPASTKADSPQSAVQVRRLQDGSLVRVRQNAQGQWESVD